MRLVYVGNFVPHHSTENCVARAFEQRGWDVERWQESDFIRTMSERQSTFARRVLGASLVLHTMTQGNMPRAATTLALWDICRDRGIPTASIHLDLFYGLSSPKRTGPQRSALPREHPMFRVDHVFTADGGHDDEWERDGVNHHWLPPGVDGDEACDVHDDERAAVDVAVLAGRTGPFLVGFAGSDNYHAEWPHRRELIEHLRDWYGDKFLHIGGSASPRIVGLALNRIFASVPVWVGDSCLTRPDFAYWSDRVPETWGRGGFLIHPHVDALFEHYDVCDMPGAGWVSGDWNALHADIEMYLDDPAHREQERRRLAAHTRTHDTYARRVAEMLGVIGLA